MPAVIERAEQDARNHRWNSQHLSINDLADRWQVSANTIRNRRVMGDGPKAMKLGGAIRYRLEDVIAYEEAQLEREA